jgi:hypothetical protein
MCQSGSRRYSDQHAGSGLVRNVERAEHPASRLDLGRGQRRLTMQGQLHLGTQRVPVAGHRGDAARTQPTPCPLRILPQDVG